jgi:hypothetical protein
VSSARILNSIPGPKRHTSEGNRPRLRGVRLRSRGSAVDYHLGGQQHKRERADGYPGARLLEHLLRYESDSALPHSGCPRQLLEPHDSRVRVGASADCGDAETARLPERGRRTA